MRMTVLGGCGAWPAAGQACSGYLLEYDGFRLLIDPGYAVLPRLLALVPAAQVDAVLVSHGHPDHCADLHPLLRARVLGEAAAPPLPVWAPAGALDPVLALDPPGSLQGAVEVRELTCDRPWSVGPFRVEGWWLPHFLPNAGLRMSAGGRVVAYTGDAGPDPQVVELAREADLFLAEATFAEQVPVAFAGKLGNARDAGRFAQQAGVRRLWLTHLWPGEPAAAVRAAAARAYPGPVEVARAGMVARLA